MLSRRTLLAGSAALAAGCSSLGSPLSPPSLPKEAELNWAVLGGFISLYDPQETLYSVEKVLQRGLTALGDDTDNPFGPRRGRYALTLRYVEDLPEPDPMPENREGVIEYFADLLDAFSADLVALPPFLARILGEEGLLLPLDRFMGAEGPKIEAAYYPFVLEYGRWEGALYALPVSALPLMVKYDAAYFEKRGVPPPNGSWDWDDLARYAGLLTERGEDGEITRWGLVSHGGFIDGIWWALFQNEAAVLDPDTMQCRLRDSSALEALQFFRDLLHTHRVSPAVASGELYKLWTGPTPPFAMDFEIPPIGPSPRSFHMAELPRGKVNAVPVGVRPGYRHCRQDGECRSSLHGTQGHRGCHARDCARARRARDIGEVGRVSEEHATG